MNTLFSASLSPLIARLTEEAAKSTAALEREFAGFSAAERSAIIQSSDYRTLYQRTKDHYLAVSPQTALLLYMLARAVKARSIVEFGASFGLSTLHLAAALQDNGGGWLITTEFEPTKIARLEKTLDEAALASLVEIRSGDAVESLAKGLPESIDLVLLDGAKSLYPRILALLEPRFHPGTVVVADNADDSPAYLSYVRDAASGYLSVPFAEDVELSLFTKAPAGK